MSAKRNKKAVRERNTEYIFKPLGKEEFKKRVTESFPSIYLTTISIIQGVALGILSYKTFGGISNSIPLVRLLPYSFVSLIIIMLISFEYAWFVGIFRWSPRVWDTLIPFVLGFSEASLIFSISDTSNWWQFTSLFGFVSALAFTNSVWNCKKAMFEKETTYRILRRELIRNYRISVIAGYFFLFVRVLHSLSVVSYPLEIIFLFIMFCFAVYMLIRGEKYLSAIHKDLMIER